MHRDQLNPGAKRLAAVSVAVSVLVACAHALGQSSFDEVAKPFLAKHCFRCHGSEKQEAQIRYDETIAYAHEKQHLWTLIHERITDEEMPPEDEPQPTAAEKEQFLKWIEREAAKAQKVAGASGIRRLNRRELSAALQDVTGLSVDYAVALPEDGKVNGFDTGAEALQDAADSVAQNMLITRRAVEGIRILSDARSTSFNADLRDVKDLRKAFDPWKAGGAYVKVRGKSIPGVGMLIDPKWLGEKGGFEMAVPPPPNNKGILRIKLTVAKFTGDFKGIPDPML
ncbi:MAG: DUF1587 domain-containing protein, partial [Pirellulales bacterium]|nr:DUF1587 domain-containing protein [Pirellulales bacterium]